MVNHRSGLRGEPGKDDDHEVPDRLGNLTFEISPHGQDQRQQTAVGNGAYQDHPANFFPKIHTGHPFGAR